MIKDLEDYYKHVNYVDERVAIYEDDEGNYMNVTPTNLLVSVQYNTLNKQEYEQAVFNQLIPKDFIANEIEIDKIVPKSEVTKKDSDRFILTTIKQKAKEVWFVMNGIGLRKAYTTKEEALKVAKEINKKIFEVCGIKVC